jgi:superfamily I DNA and/or RNA helicase
VIYANATDELLLTEQLLAIEKDEERLIFQRDYRSKSLDERRKAGLTWYPIVLQDDAKSATGFGFEVRRTSHLDAPNAFQSGQIISLFSMQEKAENPAVKGIIKTVRRDYLTIALTCEELPDWLDDGKLGIDLFFDETTYTLMEETLQQVIKAKGNRLAELREILLGYRKATFKPFEEQFLALPNLNDSQNQAVQAVLATEDALIIHGPPGTGKTTTLVEAIRVTLKQEKQVLVVAPSNLAVDLLVERLAEVGVNVLRLGHPVRVTDAVRHHTLDFKLADHPQYGQLRQLKRQANDIRTQALKFKRTYVKGERATALIEARELQRDAKDLERFITQDVLDDVQVFAATPVYVASEWLRNRSFRTVFIDEAAQMLEPATWIAVSKAQRVIFAGDDCQLPPTVKSMKAQSGGLETTLFEKFHRRQGESISRLLKTQYRMHEQIMAFSNQMFYDGKLIAHESVAKQKLFPMVEDENLNQPLEWVDTSGCGFEEVLNEETSSLYNPEEAKILIQHLLNLVFSIRFHHLEDVKIGIISPYKAQTSVLRELIREEKNLHHANPLLIVDTVDGFQGQECDVIYISLVRSNDKNEIGFLKDTRRMNVAMTRARKKLVMIGDGATISAHPFYASFLDFVNETNAYRSAWEWMG